MLKQRFLVQFGSTAVTQVIGILAGIIIARVAGPGVVGVVSYGTAYVSLLSFVCGLFGSAHIKLVSEGRDHAECLGVFSRLQFISAIIYFLVTAAWYLTQKYLLGYPFESMEVQVVIWISLFTHFIDQYYQYQNTVYTANLKQAKANLPMFFRTLAWHLGRIVIVLIGLKAVALSTWNLLLAVFMVPVLYRMLREYPKNKYNATLAKEYFRFGVPTLVIVIVNAITSYADKLLLAHFSNTTQLGYYSAAYSLGGMFMLIAGPVGSIFFPLFSGMIGRGDWTGLNDNIRKYQDFIVLFVFPLISVLILAGGPALLLVLGQRYQPSVIPFMILLLSTYITLWGLPYGNIISGMGKFYLSALIYSIRLVIFIISISVFLAPQLLNLGATGVACNLLVLSFCTNSLYLFFARKYGQVRIDKTNIIRHLVLVLIGAGGYMLASAIKHYTPYWWVIFIPVYIIISYIALFASRLMNMGNMRDFIDAINVKKTLNYVQNEISSKGE